MQARSTANGKIRREIQNPQMFEIDPEFFSPAIYFTHQHHHQNSETLSANM
jgi:hypothetical protein